MKPKHYIIGTILLLAAGLTWHFTNQLSLLKKTCFGFNGYIIKELNKNKIVIELRIKLRNQSDIAFELKAYNFNVYINNTKVTTVTSTQPQTIDRNSAAQINLLVDVVPGNILNPNFLSGFLLNYQNANIKIQGTASINAGGINKSNIPVLIESKLKDMLPTTGGVSEPCV